MRDLVLPLLVLCLSTAATPQDFPAVPPQLALSVGAAFPLGSFSSTSFDSDYPAFAGVGTQFQLSYTLPLKPYISVGATVGHRRNPFLEEEFAAPDDELVLSLESRPWQTTYTLADLQYQVPLGDGIAYLRGSAGVSYNSAASLQVQTPFGSITRDSDSSFAPAFGLGSGLRGTINRVVLGIEASLLYMRPEFETAPQPGSTRRYRQPMNSAGFSLLVGYKL